MTTKHIYIYEGDKKILLQPFESKYDGFLLGLGVYIIMQQIMTCVFVFVWLWIEVWLLVWKWSEGWECIGF